METNWTNFSWLKNKLLTFQKWHEKSHLATVTKVQSKLLIHSVMLRVSNIVTFGKTWQLMHRSKKREVKKKFLPCEIEF